MCLSANVGLGSGSKRKLSFKNVSNVVVQLLHSIRFNVDVPFSNMAASPQDLKANAARKVPTLTLQLLISLNIQFCDKIYNEPIVYACVNETEFAKESQSPQF